MTTLKRRQTSSSTMASSDFKIKSFRPEPKQEPYTFPGAGKLVGQKKVVYDTRTSTAPPFEADMDGAKGAKEAMKLWSDLAMKHGFSATPESTSASRVPFSGAPHLVRSPDETRPLPASR